MIATYVYLKAVECPACGKKLDAHTNPKGIEPPRVGDITICTNCLAVAQYAAGHALVPFPDEERAKLSVEDRAGLEEALAMVRKAKKERAACAAS